VAEAPAAPVPAPEAPAAPAPAPAPEAPAAAVVAPATTSEAADNSGSDDGYVTPLVRRLATEHSIDLATISGTGVGGRIRKQDVLDAVAARNAAASATAQTATAPTASAPVPASAAVATPVTPATPAQDSPLRGRTEPISRLRKVIAARMVESLQVSAQLTSVVEVDVTRIAVLRNRAKSSFEAREGVKLSFLPFFAKAAVEALRVYPVLNASIDVEAGTVTYHGGEHLGVAVDTERGLLVPVIRDAGDLTIAGLARKVSDIAERTRTNKVSPDELSGGTFTLTNTGSRGALFDTPIINQPQVAILGTGAVVKRPVVITDDTGAESLAIRSMVYLSLSYDHRLVDGADAARFLVAVKTRLEAAAFEADLGL
jgi:2-oxoglutarate dehydrogenase E2 component (dihydrolipoamide succinyltransferase)